jgi:hypothetical protein
VVIAYYDFDEELHIAPCITLGFLLTFFRRNPVIAVCLLFGLAAVGVFAQTEYI